jgi:hypothetical protein
MTRVVEIRTYTLHPDGAREYERLFRDVALPMLERRGVDVVAAGSSLGDPNGYFLIRAFDDLDHRQRSEDDFYGSAEWRDGPREPVLALIDSYVDLVLELDEATIDGLRRGTRPSAPKEVA